MEPVSDSELELLRIVWSEGGAALFARIMEALEERGKGWNKNTVLTFLARLVDKGYLTTAKLGRRNEYRAAVSEEQYAAAQTRVLLDRVYEGSVSGLVATLMRQDFLTQEDVEQLRRFWEEGGT